MAINQAFTATLDRSSRDMAQQEERNRQLLASLLADDKTKPKRPAAEEEKV